MIKRILQNHKYAITCPGQGIVRPGLLEPNKKYLPLMKDYLDEVDEALGQNFSRHLFINNASNKVVADFTMQTTLDAQPAILASTYIILKLFEQVHAIGLAENAKYILGHSLGEYTALTLAGVLDLTTAVQLVRLRGQLMETLIQNQNDKAEYGMIALLVRPNFVNDVIDLAKEQGILGNINSQSQIVLSGQMCRIEEFTKLESLQRKRAILKAIKLPVSIPFHNSILEAIVPELESFVEGKVQEQKVPIVLNLDGDVTTVASDTLKRTLKANYNPVQWWKSMARICDAGLEGVVNLGPGDVVHNINSKFKINNVLIDEVAKM